MSAFIFEIQNHVVASVYVCLIPFKSGGGIHSSPGFSLPVATNINRSAPNFVSLIFFPWRHALTKNEVNNFSERSRDHSFRKHLTHLSLNLYRIFSFYFFLFLTY